MTEITANENDGSVNTETIEKLGRLLKEMNITSAYYIDDFISPIELPIVSGLIKTLLEKGEANRVKEELGESINIELPDSETIIDDFAEKWETFDVKEQTTIYKKVSALEDIGFDSDEYDRTMRLKSVFPEHTLSLISPDDWRAKLLELETSLQNPDKVLLIFDQDLTKATHSDFKSGRIKGDNLIVEVKKSSLWSKSYCTLITHIIETVSEEFEQRKTIASTTKGTLEEQDFFALSKKRNENPELLCDGIKKALLDRYCSRIKEKSLSIVDQAAKNIGLLLKDINTYDFDHTILRSSYEEGVWEAETFFRITKVLFDVELKRNMISENYAQVVNEDIRRAKSLSDIRFEINPLAEPYTNKYKLRHLDIYEPSEIINTHHMPLENGYVFETIDDNDNKQLYILVSQECDLMIRSKGERENRYGILLKITSYTSKKFSSLLDTYTRDKLSKGQNIHYFAHRFSLAYFNDGTDDVGIVDFDNAVLVDLDVLDLVVFNVNGIAELDLFNSFSTSLLNIAWENRYTELYRKHTITASSLDDLLVDIEKSRISFKEAALSKFYPKISPTIQLGYSVPYNSGRFKFGVKRIKRFRNSGSKFLLDRYYKYLSRTAEAHDFASFK
jgi:hypothetical protein